WFTTQQHALYPDGKLSSDRALLRFNQPLAEGGDDRAHIIRRAAVFKPEQGMNTAAQFRR
ncbi:hypothetical protein LRD18_13290, partial [Halorhodospira halochloris]|uniref:hypothetical protein n=1 Tax=Halorhodospira halochloris TaxID=1052 RepID=UPI001EE8C707